jgi:two-component sensor histidine kinase
LSALASTSRSARKTEERLKFLTSELDHRVKNALANVCAIIRQSTGEKEYAKVLLGRIEALTRTYELLRNARSGEGVGLRAVVESAMAPFRPSGGQNVRLDGGDVILTGQATQSLAMALHELATNAAKYGALSKPSGVLDVSWRIETREGARLLRLEWRESGVPAVKPPTRSGFGTLMLKKIIPEELGGNADLNYGKGGLVCTMLLSAEHFSEKGAIHGRREPK